MKHAARRYDRRLVPAVAGGQFNLRECTAEIRGCELKQDLLLRRSSRCIVQFKLDNKQDLAVQVRRVHRVAVVPGVTGAGRSANIDRRLQALARSDRPRRPVVVAVPHTDLHCSGQRDVVKQEHATGRKL